MFSLLRRLFLGCPLYLVVEYWKFITSEKFTNENTTFKIPTINKYAIEIFRLGN